MNRILPQISNFSMMFSVLYLFLRYEFEEFEHVSSMKTLNLKSQETHSGYKTFLVVGTLYNFGEDVTSKGRVSFDVLIGHDKSYASSSPKPSSTLQLFYLCPLIP